jgi:hypothetical protein
MLTACGGLADPALLVRHGQDASGDRLGETATMDGKAPSRIGRQLLRQRRLVAGERKGGGDLAPPVVVGERLTAVVAGNGPVAGRRQADRSRVRFVASG